MPGIIWLNNKDRRTSKNKWLTHISIMSFNGTWANSADPDQTPHNVVSDQDLHCLLTECYVKILKKKISKYQPLPLKFEMGSSN